MYENRHHPGLSRTGFRNRPIRHVAIMVALVDASLLASVVSYCVLEVMSWVDTTLKASTIIEGLDPVQL